MRIEGRDKISVTSFSEIKKQGYCYFFFAFFSVQTKSGDIKSKYFSKQQFTFHTLIMVTCMINYLHEPLQPSRYPSIGSAVSILSIHGLCNQPCNAFW